jgi:hypothetical protein
MSAKRFITLATGLTYDLYYKHVTIVNEDSSVISEQSFQPIEDARGVIYDRRMFIIQAIEVFLGQMLGRPFEVNRGLKNLFIFYFVFHLLSRSHSQNVPTLKLTSSFIVIKTEQSKLVRLSLAHIFCPLHNVIGWGSARCPNCKYSIK